MNEKVSLITGASSGIGLLTALELARRGHRVVATMRDLGRRETLAKAAADAKLQDRIEVRRLDVAEFASIPQAIAEVLRDYGHIDVLVNNAGFVYAGFAEDLLLTEVRQQLETNFFGQLAVTQAVLPGMRARGSGHVIMVSSESGRMGQPGCSAYCASKFALEGWSETLRIEMRALGVKVVLVEPGAFRTDIWDRNTKISDLILKGVSPNQERGRKLKEWAVTTHKSDPAVVARLIGAIADNPNPRLRYIAGRDAVARMALRAVLPWSWYERLVVRTVGLQ